jgi:hypothetical protein
MVMTRATWHLQARIAAWILAVLFTSGGIAEAGSDVLCIGEDGHADVEFSLAVCCSLAPPSDFRAPSAMELSDGSGCDDCVDLRFGADSLKAGKKFLPSSESTVTRVLTPDRMSGATSSSAPTDLVFQGVLATVVSPVVLLV